MRKIIFLFHFVILSLAFSPAPTSAAIFNAQSTTLENGLQVVFIPNHRAPVVTHMLWIRAGAVDEPQGIAGLAHFLEHLMFKGTRDTAPGEFSRRIKMLGGDHNAFTSKDYTAYFETVSKEHLDEVMRLNADRMINLAPPQEEILSEREVVLEERRQRVDNSPSAQFHEHMRAAHYLTHPYANPVIGWMKELERINWPQAQDFYHKYYVPNNMILVVTGDLDFETLVSKAKRHYGSLKPASIPQKPSPVLPDLVGEKTLVYAGEKIRQPGFSRIYNAPSFQMNKKQAYALEVLSEILSGAPSTYLHDRLVVKEKLVSGISSYYYAYARYHTSFNFSATPLPGVEMETLRLALDQALEELYTKGLSREMVSRARQRLIAQAIYARDSLQGPAMITGRALMSGATIEDIETWDQHIEKITREDVLEALKRYLITPGRAPVTGYLKTGTYKHEAQNKAEK